MKTKHCGGTYVSGAGSLSSATRPSAFSRMPNSADVRVVQRRGEPGLTLEAFDGIDVLRQLLLEDLDGHRAGKPGIPRLIDHAHAACAQRSNDVEMGNLSTDHVASLSRVPPPSD